MGKEKKKISQIEIFESIAENLWRTTSAKLQFGENIIAQRFHVETSPEGIKRCMIEGEGQVMRYIHEDAVISAVNRWTYDLPDKTYKDFKLTPSQIKNAATFWKNCSHNFPEKIAPVLQKSTEGYCFHRLDFDMQEGPTPTFDLLVGSMEANAEAAISYLGSLFDPESTVQQYLWLQGQGGDGKGTLFRFLKKIFNDSYCAFDTEERSLDKYWAGQFVGKRLAICGDCRNENFVHYTPFMQITGGDAVAIREMQKTAYTAHLPTRFIFGANTLPNISSQSSDQRRAIICPMRRTVEDMVEGFEEKLWQERASIVWKCWQAWLRVKNQFMIPTNKEYHAELARNNEELFEILADKYLEFSEEEKELRSDVTRAIQDEKLIGHRNKQISLFYSFLERNYGVQMKKVHGVRYLEGCKLKPIESYKKPLHTQEGGRF